MTEKKLTTIDFHGARLVALPGDALATTLVAMRPMVDGMGLNWGTQFRKIDSHAIFSTCVVKMTTQMPGDDQAREHVFLPLNRLPSWLNTIQPRKIKDPEIRAKVIDFQTEAADVLFAHFFGKAAEGASMGTGYRAFTVEEIRAGTGFVREARQTWGRPGAIWAWLQTGWPVPPRHLWPAWMQGEINFGAPGAQGGQA